MIARAVHQGFTLIELMIALAIAALLLTLGMPSFNEFLRNSEIRSTTESLVNGLRVARAEAIRRNLPVTFTLVSGGPGWTVDQVDACPATNIQKYSESEGGTNTVVARKTIAGAASTAVSVTFNGMGRIDPTATTTACAPAATPNLERLDITSTGAAGISRPLHIVLPVDAGTQGIRVCDPNMPVIVPPDPRAC
jgi:type IV fimbrial biogenesis protein FimT